MSAGLMCLVGIAGLVLGMACPFVAFIVLKPVLKRYWSESQRLTAVDLNNIAQLIPQALQPPPAARVKGDRRGVFKPKRDADEDVSQ